MADAAEIAVVPQILSAPPRPERPDPYTYYRRRLLSPARVRELSQPRPRQVILDTLVVWVTIVAMFAAVACYRSWWVALLAVPVVGSRYYALFIIGHDGLHRRLFRDVYSNDLFNDLFILGPIGAITGINNQNHLLHHQHLARPNDPDRHKHGCFNKTTSVEFAGYLTGISSIVRSVANVFFRKKAAIPGRRGYSLRDLLILGSWQLLLLGGLTLGIGWWAYPVLWLFPVYVFTFLADNFRSFAEHSHPEADGQADRHRLITFDSNPIERLFIAPMNMNYHAAHHLWPSIPYFNLPTADAEMRRLPAAGELLWRRSYVGYLLRYWAALPLAECRHTNPG